MEENYLGISGREKEDWEWKTRFFFLFVDFFDCESIMNEYVMYPDTVFYLFLIFSAVNMNFRFPLEEWSSL